MIGSYSDLSERQIDVLREIGNIGAGNAATSLSVLLDEGVSISIPQLHIENYSGVVSAVGDPEELAVGILVHFTGEVRGMVLFLLGFEDAKEIAQMLVGREADDEPVGLSEMKISMIKEIGNILSSAYLGSIGMLTGLTFDISVPYAAIDMAGALLAAPMLEFSVDDTKIMFIEESFQTETKSLRSHVILFADIPSLNVVMEKLGI
ncbi:MAG: chemotaxis protein CheC [Clostridiales Family XIII bacterium]|jgi:chemotaxis protein CheC|nr:chemotaxis protein CheC [Clostridiales Family XIII bacterium]